MRPRISIVISALNEEKRLPTSLVALEKFENAHPELELEIILVDDGSTDHTAAIIKSSNYATHAVFKQKNEGKGAGLRAGVEKTSGSLVYLADADFSTPVETLPDFINKLEEGYDCVIGSRAMSNSAVTTSLHKKLLGRMGNTIINLLLPLSLKDTQCGFKLLNSKAREVFLRTTIPRWGFDFEFLLMLKDADLQIAEMPVKWDNTEDSRVGPFDYLRTLRDLIKVWWRYQGRKM